MKKTNKSLHISLALPAFIQSGDLLLQRLHEAQGINKALADVKHAIGPALDAMLFQLLTTSVNLNTPYAAISALGYGFAAETGHWLRLDPTELLVDGGNICLVGRDHLLLATDEVKQVLDSLNQLLTEEHMIIKAGSAHEWFLQLPHAPEIETGPLHEVLAKDIRPYLPKGPKAKFWHKLLTEFQMLLFQHSINTKRQNERRPLLNNVWLWGEGQISEKYSLKPYTQIWSDHSFLKGMLHLAKLEQYLLSSKHFFDAAILAPGNYLVTLDHYQLGLEFLLQTIISLLRRVQDRTIDQFNLYLGNGQIFEWTAPRKRFFGIL